MPTENRTTPSVIPTCSRTAFGTPACVIVAGWQTRLSTPPRLSASVNNSSFRQNASASPSMANVIMPEPPAIWRLASACCGWLGINGYRTHWTRFSFSSQPARASALAQWRSIRTASVRWPRVVSHASNGDGWRPRDFCANVIRLCQVRSLVATIPPRQSLWPLTYFVVDDNDNVAPSSSGR